MMSRSHLLFITNGLDFLPISRACHVCRIWFDRDQSEDSRVVPIVLDTAYMTGMTNRQTGSKDNNTDSPLVIASPPSARFPGAKYTRPSISLDMALQLSPKGPPHSLQGVTA